MEQDEKRAAFVQGLRDLADFYETTPTAPMPYVGNGFSVHPEDRAHFAKWAAVIGATSMAESSGWARAQRWFGPIPLVVAVEAQRLVDAPPPPPVTLPTLDDLLAEGRSGVRA